MSNNLTPITEQTHTWHLELVGMTAKAKTRTEIRAAIDEFLQNLSGRDLLQLANQKRYKIRLERDNLLIVEVPYVDIQGEAITHEVPIFLHVQTHPDQKCIPQLKPAEEEIVTMIKHSIQELLICAKALQVEIKKTREPNQPFLLTDSLEQALIDLCQFEKELDFIHLKVLEFLYKHIDSKTIDNTRIKAKIKESLQMALDNMRESVAGLGMKVMDRHIRRVIGVINQAPSQEIETTSKSS